MESYGGEFSGGLKHNRYGFAQISTIANNVKTERMRFTTNGHVGIGITNPTVALDVNGAINATSFNATSDYRIKNNVYSIIEDASFNVDVLKPVSYFNTKLGKPDIGFIAHEVQEHYPYLVNGEKDGEAMQTLNYTGIIGIIVKEVQELKKKDAIKEQRIQDLEKMVLDLKEICLRNA